MVHESAKSSLQAEGRVMQQEGRKEGEGVG